MVTKVMEAAPPTRKYEIMSGNTKAALKASASMPTPKSQAMYLSRTRPIMCERKAEAISTRVAVKTVCTCVGRSSLRPRAHLVCAGTEGWVEGDSATEDDSTGVERQDEKRRCTTPGSILILSGFACLISGHAARSSSSGIAPVNAWEIPYTCRPAAVARRCASPGLQRRRFSLRRAGQRFEPPAHV